MEGTSMLRDHLVLRDDVTAQVNQISSILMEKRANLDDLLAKEDLLILFLNQNNLNAFDDTISIINIYLLLNEDFNFKLSHYKNKLANVMGLPIEKLNIKITNGESPFQNETKNLVMGIQKIEKMLLEKRENLINELDTEYEKCRKDLKEIESINRIKAILK